MSKHVVMFSGGVASYAVARRVVAKEDKRDVVLLFADTKIEDGDLYRFLHDAENRLGVPITRIAEGRNPWKVFNDEGMIGNTRADLCSRILKREPLRSWLETHCTPEKTIVYLGYDGNEGHRLGASERFWAPWPVRAPLVEEFIFREQIFKELIEDEIDPPRLYGMGFAHNNCGGFCIKAGHAAFATLLRELPGRFEQHAAQERSFRARTRKNVSILRDRIGGSTKPFTLDALRERIERQPELLDAFDIGGCGCMDPGEEKLSDDDSP